MPSTASSPQGTAHWVDGRRVAVGGYLAAADPALIKRGEITHIVKMFADDPSYPGGWHRHAGVAYFVAAADDRPDYDIRGDLYAALQFIRDALRDPAARVLVHCHAGVSRSVTVAVAHLMVAHGHSVDNALAQIRRARPCAQPNSGFMRHLRATEARLRRKHALREI